MLLTKIPLQKPSNLRHLYFEIPVKFWIKYLRNVRILGIVHRKIYSDIGMVVRRRVRYYFTEKRIYIVKFLDALFPDWEKIRRRRRREFTVYSVTDRHLAVAAPEGGDTEREPRSRWSLLADLSLYSCFLTVFNVFSK